MDEKYKKISEKLYDFLSNFHSEEDLKNIADIIENNDIVFSISYGVYSIAEGKHPVNVRILKKEDRTHCFKSMSYSKGITSDPAEVINLFKEIYANQESVDRVRKDVTMKNILL